MKYTIILFLAILFSSCFSLKQTNEKQYIDVCQFTVDSIHVTLQKQGTSNLVKTIIIHFKNNKKIPLAIDTSKLNYEVSKDSFKTFMVYILPSVSDYDHTPIEKITLPKIIQPNETLSLHINFPEFVDINNVGLAFDFYEVYGMEKINDKTTYYDMSIEPIFIERFVRNSCSEQKDSEKNNEDN